MAEFLILQQLEEEGSLGVERDLDRPKPVPGRSRPERGPPSEEEAGKLVGEGGAGNREPSGAQKTCVWTGLGNGRSVNGDTHDVRGQRLTLKWRRFIAI